MTSAEFAAAVHAYIFVRAHGGVVRKPAVKPINGWGFGGKRSSENTPAIVICDEGITCLTVETHEVIETLRVPAALNHESKVDRETLETDGGNHSGCGPTRGFA